MPNPIDSLSYGLSGVSTPNKSPTDQVARAFRCLRDGTLAFADFKLICAMEGVLLQSDLGSLTTLVTGHVALTQLQPDGNIDVPAGTGIIVLPPCVYVETSAGTLNRVAMSSLSQTLGNGTSTAATVPPYAVRSDKRSLGLQNGSCVVRQAFSANGIALGANIVQLEHWRSGYPFADATGAPIKRFQPSLDEWSWPILIGPASFQIYVAATTTAPTFWAQLGWIELPSNQFV